MGSGITKADYPVSSGEADPEEQRDSDLGAVYNFDFTTDWLRRFCKSLILYDAALLI